MKPDRFEQMVDRATSGDPGMKNGLRLGHDEIVQLLLRQHAAYVRMIHRLRLHARKAAFATVLAKKRPDWHDAKIEVLDDLLDAFARYKKVKP